MLENIKVLKTENSILQFMNNPTLFLFQKSHKHLTTLNIVKYLATLRIVSQIGNSKYKLIRWVNRDISNMQQHIVYILLFNIL